MIEKFFKDKKRQKITLLFVLPFPRSKESPAANSNDGLPYTTDKVLNSLSNKSCSQKGKKTLLTSRALQKVARGTHQAQQDRTIIQNHYRNDIAFY